MSKLLGRTASDGLKLLVFMVVTSLATGLLVLLIGNFTFGETKTYRAQFSDVTGLVSGDDVRMAGVKIGSVDDIEILNRTNAIVSFSVKKGVPMTASSNASIRYRNLVGQRYISLTQAVGDPTVLPENSTLDLAHTQEALDLSVLFNGFKPLFAALSPADINRLSYQLIQVFQGEGTNINGLLTNTAAFTQTLASRDRAVGEMIDNLNRVLTRIGGREKELTRMIKQFQIFVTGVNKDRNVLFGTLNNISTLAEETAGLVRGIRDPFVKDIKALRQLTGNLKVGRKYVDSFLKILPLKLNKIGRTASYGSFFNFYVCEIKANIHLPLLPTIPVNINTGSDRCTLP